MKEINLDKEDEDNTLLWIDGELWELHQLKSYLSKQATVNKMLWLIYKTQNS